MHPKVNRKKIPESVTNGKTDTHGIENGSSLFQHRHVGHRWSNSNLQAKQSAAKQALQMDISSLVPFRAPHRRRTASEDVKDTKDMKDKDVENKTLKEKKEEKKVESARWYEVFAFMRSLHIYIMILTSSHRPL